MRCICPWYDSGFLGQLGALLCHSTRGPVQQVTSPALVQARYAAVIFISSALIEHAGMHDVAHGHVEVIGEEVLQNF